MPEMKDHEAEYARVRDEYQQSLPVSLREISRTNEPLLTAREVNVINHSADEVERLRAELVALKGAVESLPNTSMAEQANKAVDIVKRLRGACIGHPHAKIPWPHRLLHEVADLVERLRDDLADLQSHFDSTALNDGIVIDALRAELASMAQGVSISIPTMAMEQEIASHIRMAVHKERQEIDQLRAELATTKSSEYEGWRYTDELEQKRKRLTAELAEGKRLVREWCASSYAGGPLFLAMRDWKNSATGSKTPPDEHAEPAGGEKPA